MACSRENFTFTVLFIVIMLLKMHNHCTFGNTFLPSIILIYSPGTLSAILNVVLALYIVLRVIINMGTKHGMQ